MIIVTSNKNKIKEFKNFLGNSLKVEKGKDLKEIDSPILTKIAVYKAKEAGKDRIVEDSVLEVDGKPLVDIRWNNDYKKQIGKKARWITTLAYNDGKDIYCYQGIVEGKIVKPRGNHGFAFDPFLQPDGSKKTLAEMTTNEKQDYSARVRAIMNLKNRKHMCKQSIKNIKTWQGRWQND